MIIIHVLMPVNLIVLHMQEPYWYSMTAAFWPTQLLRHWALLFFQLISIR
jgi:hypothetical protein